MRSQLVVVPDCRPPDPTGATRSCTDEKHPKMSGLDTIPGQRGYLVVSADGSVLQSAGELQNDEHTATIMLQMVQNSGKLMNTLSSERTGSFHRLSVVYRHHTLVACVWNQRIHIVKRINKEN